MMDKFLQNNLVMKILAVLLAVMLWLIVGMDGEPEMNGAGEGQRLIDNVQVDVEYDDQAYTIVEMQDTVQVLLSGRRDTVNSTILRGDHYRIIADLTELGDGEHTVQLVHEGFPDELEVEIIPASILVELEEQDQQEFPIEVELIGEPADGYIVDDVHTDQQTAAVYGPSAVLERVELVQGYINIDAIEGSLETDVILTAYDVGGNELDVEIHPNTIEAEVIILPEGTSVPVQYFIDESLPDGYSLIDINTHAQEAVIHSEEDLVEIDELRIDIDLSELEESQVLHLSPDIQSGWAAIRPEVFVVEVEIGETRERSFSNLPIDVQGVEEGYYIEFIEPNGGSLDSLVLAGAGRNLRELERDDIQAIVDVHDLATGEHTLEVTVRLTGKGTYYTVKERPEVRLEVSEMDENE